MKLAIIRTFYKPLRIGAYNVQEIGLAKELAKRGIETHIYSRYMIGNREGEFDQISEMVSLRNLKGRKVGKDLVFAVGDAQIPFEDYDWVQIQEYANIMSRPLIKIAKSKGCRVLINQGTYQDYKGPKRLYNIILDRWVLDFLKKNVDKFFAKTALAKEYLNNKGFSNVQVVPVGMDMGYLEDAVAPVEPAFETFKKRFSKIILYIGQIESRRNPSFIIEIISRMVKKDPNSGFVIIGSGKLSKWFDREIADKQLTPYIFRRKSVRQADLSEYYLNSNIFILPSNYEIFGMVVLEALYFGLPVISTNTAGPHFILTGDSKLGKCLPLEIEDWLDFIGSINDNDKLQNGSFRNAYIINNFSWEKRSTHYESLDH